MVDPSLKSYNEQTYKCDIYLYIYGIYIYNYTYIYIYDIWKQTYKHDTYFYTEYKFFLL